MVQTWQLAAMRITLHASQPAGWSRVSSSIRLCPQQVGQKGRAAAEHAQGLAASELRCNTRPYEPVHERARGALKSHQALAGCPAGNTSRAACQADWGAPRVAGEGSLGAGRGWGWRGGGGLFRPELCHPLLSDTAVCKDSQPVRTRRWRGRPSRRRSQAACPPAQGGRGVVGVVAAVDGAQGLACGAALVAALASGLAAGPAHTPQLSSGGVPFMIAVDACTGLMYAGKQGPVTAACGAALVPALASGRALGPADTPQLSSGAHTSRCRFV